MSKEKPFKGPFQKHEVEDYERKRYRGLDQKLVDSREKRILRKILDKIGNDSARVLDLPSGYGRFSNLLLERRFTLASSDLSFHMVKRTIEKSKLCGLHSGVVADAKKGLPFKNHAFTILLSMRLFHHVQRREEREFILNEFSGVSAEWVILSYYQKTLFHILQRKLRRKVKKTKTRISMISGKEFKEEVRRAGLKVVKIFPIFRVIHAHNIALLKKG